MGTRYQGYVDDAYVAGQRLESQGLLRGNPNTRLGDFVDRYSARDLKTYLRSEGISEGPSSLVEMSRWLRDEAIVFTINLGIVCGQLLEGDESSLKGVGIVDAHVRQRVGMLLPDRPDKWWTIDPKADTTSLIEEISGLIEREAAPYLDRYLNDDALVALWESGQSPGLTETQRLRYLTRPTAAKECAE